MATIFGDVQYSQVMGQLPSPASFGSKMTPGPTENPIFFLSPRPGACMHSSKDPVKVHLSPELGDRWMDGSLNIRGMCSDWKSPKKIGIYMGKSSIHGGFSREPCLKLRRVDLDVIKCMFSDALSKGMNGLPVTSLASINLWVNFPVKSPKTSRAIQCQTTALCIDFSMEKNPKTMEVPRDNHRFVGALLKLPVAPMIRCSFFIFVGHPWSISPQFDSTPIFAGEIWTTLLLRNLVSNLLCNHFKIFKISFIFAKKNSLDLMWM